jgi:hypothetical protein
MIVWLIALNIMTLGRLFAFQSDRSASWKRMVPAAIGQVAFLLVLLKLDRSGLFVIGCTLAANLVPLLSERSERWHVHLRLIIFVAYAAAVGFAQNRISPELHMDWIGPVIEFFERSIFAPPLAKIRPEHALALSLGFILCLEETNMLLRVLLKALEVNPPQQDQSTPPDPGSFLRGGLVGSIERMLIFVFVVHAAFNAISFVIAAKGIARFNEMTKSASSEYILIGTLLSALFAMALGLAAMQL